MKQLRVLLGSARGTDVYHRFYVSSKKDRCKSVKLEVGAGARGHFNWNQLKQLASIERAADSASLRPQRDFMWSAYARSHDSLSVLVFFFNYCHACGYMTGASFQRSTVGSKRPSSLPTNVHAILYAPVNVDCRLLSKIFKILRDMYRYSFNFLLFA